VERKNDKGDHLQGWSLYLHACKLGLIRVPQYKCGFLRRGRLRLSSYTTPSTLGEAPVSTIQLGYRYGQSKSHQTTTIWYLRDVSDSILHIQSDLCTYEQTFNSSPTGFVRTGRTETKRIEKVSLEVCGTWCLFTLKNRKYQPHCRAPREPQRPECGLVVTWQGLSPNPNLKGADLELPEKGSIRSWTTYDLSPRGLLDTHLMLCPACRVFLIEFV
jgi:hypothetical protein